MLDARKCVCQRQRALVGVGKTVLISVRSVVQLHLGPSQKKDVEQRRQATQNCLAYSAFSRCQPPNFIASGPTKRPIGVPLSRRSRTSKQMCHPAAPMEMK